MARRGSFIFFACKSKISFFYRRDAETRGITGKAGRIFYSKILRCNQLLNLSPSPLRSGRGVTARG